MAQVKSNEDLSLKGLGKIKIHSSLNESNLNYKHHNNITDNDIYYYWGYKDLFGIRQAPLVVKAGTKTIGPEDKDKIIEYAKNKMRPILPDEYEFIPREYWLDFKDFMGEDLSLLHHPMWWLTQQLIKEYYKPSSDTLIIQACSNMKPYIDNRNYAITRPLFEQGYCDLVVNSCELTPIEFTIFYPWRHYDWSHLQETEFVTECLLKNNFHSIVSFINTFHYKKVLILGPYNPTGEGYNYHKLYELVKDNYEGTDVEVIEVMDEELYEENLKSLGGPGFTKARYQISHPTRDKLYKLLNYNESSPSNPYVYGKSLKVDEEFRKKLIEYFYQDYKKPNQENEIKSKAKTTKKHPFSGIYVYKEKDTKPKASKGRGNRNHSFNLPSYLYDRIPYLINNSTPMTRKELINDLYQDEKIQEYSKVYLIKNIDSMIEGKENKELKRNILLYEENGIIVIREKTFDFSQV